MTPEEKARVETLKHWTPNDPNYQFLIDLIERQDELIQEDNEILDAITEHSEGVMRGIHLFMPPRPIIVVTIGEKARLEGMFLASKLRQQGETTILAPNKSMKAQMRYASALNAYNVFILGDQELEKKTVLVRNMDKSTQEEIEMSVFVTSKNENKDSIK